MTREPIIVELPEPLAGWLCTIAARDLRTWAAADRGALSKEDATAFAMFLADSLPAEVRPFIPPVGTHFKAG